MTTTRFFVLVSFLFWIFLVGCNKEEDPLDGDDALYRIGQSAFKVTGNIQGEFTGGSILYYSPVTEEFAVTMHDHSPQHFAMRIVDYHDNLGLPDPGEYRIGQQPRYEERDADFTVEFDEFVDNTYMGESHTYTTQFGGSGILRITKSGPDEVKGSFEFSAHRYLFNDDGAIIPDGIGEKIEVEGTFTAKSGE